MKHVKRIYRIWDNFEARITRRFTPFQKKLWAAFIFLSRFVLLAIPFNVILWTNFDAYPLQVIVTKATTYLLSLSSVDATQAENFIYIKASVPWTIEVIKDCVGWKSFLALTGLIFAVRKIEMKDRITGMIFGAPIIFFGNIIRIYTTVYVGVVFGFRTFAAVHEFLWQIGMMALIIANWLIWLRFVGKKRRRINNGITLI